MRKASPAFFVRIELLDRVRLTLGLAATVKADLERFVSEAIIAWGQQKTDPSSRPETLRDC